MLDALADQLGRALGHSWWMAPFLALGGGLLTGFNPCAYPTFPAIIGYIGAQTERTRFRGFLLSCAFVLGLALIYVLIGTSACYLSSKLRISQRTWHYLAAAVCLLVGIHLSGLYHFSFPRSSLAQVIQPKQRGMLGAILLGSLFGVAATPCATPVVAVIVTLGASAGQVAYAGLLLFLYAVGHGLPLILLGTFTGAVSELARFTRWSASLQPVGGVLLILVGLYLLWMALG